MDFKNEIHLIKTLCNFKRKSQYKMKIAVYNGFAFHYEMFGYIIEFCRDHRIKLDIYTETQHQMKWIDFYIDFFPKCFTLQKHTSYPPKNDYDKIIVATDDDASFKDNWLNDRVIVIDHHYTNRRQIFPLHIGTRFFPSRPSLDWTLPVYRLIDLNIKKNVEKNAMVFIGTNARVDHRIISKQFPTMICIFIDRYVDTYQIDTIYSYNNLSTPDLIYYLRCSSFVVVTDIDTEHIDKKMSASIPIALATLCTLVMPKKMNAYYKLSSAIEYETLSDLTENMLKHNSSTVNKDLQHMIIHRNDVFKKYLVD